MNAPHHPLTANKRILGGRGLAPVLLKRAATLELDWATRQQQEFTCTDSLGRSLRVNLPHSAVIRGGDVLVAQDGSMVRVIAAAQPVLRITHCPAHGTPSDLLRAAYLLGMRQVPVELAPNHLQVEPEPIVAGMLQSMHMILTPVEAPFEPESAAGAFPEPVATPALGPWAHDQAYAHHDHAGCKHEH